MQIRALLAPAVALLAASCTFPVAEGTEAAVVGGYASPSISPNAIYQHRIGELSEKNQTYLQAAQDATTENASLKVTLEQQQRQIDELRTLSTAGTEPLGTVINIDQPRTITTIESETVTESTTGGIEVVPETSPFEPAPATASFAAPSFTEPGDVDMDVTVEEVTEPQFEPSGTAPVNPFGAPATPFADTSPTAVAPAFGEVAPSPEPGSVFGTDTPTATPAAPLGTDASPNAPAMIESPTAPVAPVVPLETPAAPGFGAAATPAAPGFGATATPAAEVAPAFAPATVPVPTPVNPFTPEATPAAIAPAVTPGPSAFAPAPPAVPAAGTAPAVVTPGAAPTPGIVIPVAPIPPAPVVIPGTATPAP